MMNKQKNSNLTFVQFLLKAQYLAQEETRSEKGYAMMMTSIISIVMLSTLAAYMTMTNLSKSSTNAYVDSTNTFYAAESGLNKRANELREKFLDYATPSGTVPGSTTSTTSSAVTAATIANCFSISVNATVSATNDFECRNYPFKYNNNVASVRSRNGEIVLSDKDSNDNTVDYIAHTFVAPKQNYTTNPPSSSVIPSEEIHAGLNALEYKYTVYATATKPNKTNSVAPNFTAAEIAAKQRTVKIAGDAALIASYDAKQSTADTQNMTSAATSSNTNTVLQMDFRSRVIPMFQYGAFYAGDLEFNPSPVMTFNGRLHSNANMYLTAGSGTGESLTIDGVVTAAGRIYAGNPPLPNNYNSGGPVLITKSAGVTQALPTNTAPTSTAVEVTDLTLYNNKVKNTTTPVRPLTMPGAGLLTKLDANQSDGIGEYYGKADLRLEMFPNRAVPFNFQVLASGTTETTVTCEAVNGSVFNNTETGGTKTVSIDRKNYAADNTVTPATKALKCTNLAEGQLRSLMQPVLVRPKTTLEYTTFCTTAGAGTAPKVSTTPVAITNSDLATKERILDALALTIAAQTTPVNYSTLATAGSLSTDAKNQFDKLLNKISGLDGGDITTLKAAAPTAIAALASTTTNGNTIKGSCFRPAPIQALFTPSGFTTAALAANTATNFNDRREGRYIRMLQTNIESLTLWNRDGLFTQGLFDNQLNTSDAIAADDLATKFTINATTKAWTERANSSGDDLLFVKDTAKTVEADGTTAIPVQSYRGMGLAAVDRTEGGLVFHATIDKTTYSYTARQSPYGFSFNDGANLPAPLTIATDQAAYSQGDWNIFDKQSASILADSISLLSTNCLATTDVAASGSRPAQVAGQINCGRLTGLDPATATTVNAAFLARTDASTATYYSGGLNNYMRILENWTGVAMNYRGSFVSLGIPQEVSGQYIACTTSGFTFTAATYGCPPNRFWSYETNFDTYSKLPPLSPRVVELKQDVFKRTY
jgi:hypothetical protein